MRRKRWSIFIGIVLASSILIGPVPAAREESRSGYSSGAFRLEMEGSEQKGILQIVELMPYRAGLRAVQEQEGMAAHRVFTRYVTPPFKSIRIADYDHPSRLNQWVKDSILARNSRLDPVTKAHNLDIIILKGTEEKMRFRVKNAWIREISYSDLDRSSGGRLKETLVIESESIDPTY